MATYALVVARFYEDLAARLQAAHVRALAVAVLELGLGVLGDGLRAVVLVVVGLLGEAEVHERSMPGVSERHGLKFRGCAWIPCNQDCSESPARR